MAIRADTQSAQSANQHRHFSWRKPQKMRTIQHHLFRRDRKFGFLIIAKAIRHGFKNGKRLGIGLLF